MSTQLALLPAALAVPRSRRRESESTMKAAKLRSASVLVAFATVLLLVSASPAAAQVTLGPTVGGLCVLGGSTVKNTGSSIVNGNLGVSPGSAVTGFPPGVVVG